MHLLSFHIIVWLKKKANKLLFRDAGLFPADQQAHASSCGKADERDQRIDDDHAISVHGEIKGDGRHEQEDGEKRKQPGESSAAAGKADGQRQPRHQEQQDDHRGIRILHRQRHEIIVRRQQEQRGQDVFSSLHAIFLPCA